MSNTNSTSTKKSKGGYHRIATEMEKNFRALTKEGKHRPEERYFDVVSQETVVCSVIGVLRKLGITDDDIKELPLKNK